MPHLVTHRPRVMNLASSDETAPSHKTFETFSALSYELGGVTFVAGSVFFFPVLSEHIAIGDLLFLVGSILYLLVTGHELLEVLKYWRHHETDTFADNIERLAACCYFTGSVLFTVGSVLFLPRISGTTPGSWMFIVGSVLFVIGGIVNVLQVVEAPSLLYMQLFNYTIGLFMMGSALFAVVTIPYLWPLNGAAGIRIENLSAGVFLVASCMFLSGGMAIFYRKMVRDKLEKFCHATGLGTMFISALRSEIEEKSNLTYKDHGSN